MLQRAASLTSMYLDTMPPGGCSSSRLVADSSLIIGRRLKFSVVLIHFVFGISVVFIVFIVFIVLIVFIVFVVLILACILEIGAIFTPETGCREHAIHYRMTRSDFQIVIRRERLLAEAH